MASNGASAVVVFEPLPANIVALERFIELNSTYDITLMRMALGEASGETEMLVMPETSMAKLSASPFQAEESWVERFLVPVDSVDSLVECGELRPPNLIKLDVEGAEMMVLRGAEQVLRAHRPVMFAEIHSPALLAESRNFLAGLGYAIDVIEGDEAATVPDTVFQIVAHPTD